jgi:hypothetical protein
VRSPVSELRRVADYFMIDATTAAIENVAANHTFQKLSGGRAPGELDDQSHYRRGLPDEWKEVFNEEELTQPIMVAAYTRYRPDNAIDLPCKHSVE